MHPLELNEIVVEVAQYLSLQDQARCARVAWGWLRSFSPFVWFDVHIDDTRPLPCYEAFARNGRFIRRLRTDDPYLVDVLLPLFDSTHTNATSSLSQQQQPDYSNIPVTTSMVGRGSGCGSSSGINSGKDKGKGKVDTHQHRPQYQQQSIPTSPPPLHQQQQQQRIVMSGLCQNLTGLRLSCWESTRRMLMSKGVADYEQVMVVLASKWTRLIAFNPMLRDFAVEFYGQVGPSVLPAFTACLDRSLFSSSSFSTLLSPAPSSSSSFFSSMATALPTLRSLDLRSYPLGREEIVHVLLLCPFLERIRLEESPFPDSEDPIPCHPTPFPRMTHVQRLEFDFRRDPPAAIAIDLIEQCPNLQELRIEVENMHPFRYLPPILKDNQNEDDGPCYPELHTLELEICYEWISLPAEHETAAIVEAILPSCRHLTLRGCTLLETLPTTLTNNRQWMDQLVTLDLLRTKNVQGLILCVLENCPALQVLRATKLSLSRFVAWTDERQPWMDGKPWVCLGLREWSVAITGIDRNHNNHNDNLSTNDNVDDGGSSGEAEEEDDDDDEEEEDGAATASTGHGDDSYESEEDGNDDEEGDGNDVSDNNNSESDVVKQNKVVDSNATINNDNDNDNKNSNWAENVENIKEGVLEEDNKTTTPKDAAFSDKKVDDIIPDLEMIKLDDDEWHHTRADKVFHVPPSLVRADSSVGSIETTLANENSQIGGTAQLANHNPLSPQMSSPEEERADKIERVILQQLGCLQNLEILRIGGCSTLDEVNEEIQNKASYALSFSSGLECLTGLKRLRVFGAYGVRHQVSWTSLEWMVQQWPQLSRLELLDYERMPPPPASSSASSSCDRRRWCQRVLDEIIS